MSGIPLAVEIISLFFIVLFFLHNYADFRRQNRIILLATFVAWYFSIMIVILLPMDISLVRINFNQISPSSLTFYYLSFLTFRPRIVNVSKITTHPRSKTYP